MSRSVKWKKPYCSPSLLEQISKLENNGEKTIKTIKTMDRSSVILPEFIGHSLEVYNGKDWIPLKVTQEHVGYKLGEFSPTKMVAVYKRKSKAKSSRKKA